MFIHKLKRYFTGVLIVGVLFMLYNFYQSYSYNNNPLSDTVQAKIEQKRQTILSLIRSRFGLDFDPIFVLTSALPNNMYGLTAYRGEGQIIVYINKNRLKESLDYVLKDVISHEYAHAVMFRLGYFQSRNAGHSVKWQEICFALQGEICNRFVNHQDVVLDKLKLKLF